MASTELAHGTVTGELEVATYRSLTEFRQKRAESASEFEERAAFEKSLPTGADTFAVEGFCRACMKQVGFEVDHLYSDPATRTPNWRERLVCPECRLNNRIRASIHLLEQLRSPGPGTRLYITEQTTPLYRLLRKRFPKLQGSEYLGSSVPLGKQDPRGISNEDLTQLTFRENSFDAVLSFDVFEHIPNYRAALAECCRVLRPGGMLLFTVPFALGTQENLVRAVVKPDGEINHLLPPEYHGDPVNDRGCLAFYCFGWDMMDDLQRAGFENCRILGVWSDEYGYLGAEQPFIVAEKPGSPAAIDEPDNLTPEAYNDVACELYRSGNIEAARCQLEMSHRDYPHDVATLRNLTDVMLETGDFGGARDMSFKILGLKPDDVDAYFSLGSAMASLKLLKRAADYFGRVKRLRPDYPQIDEILSALPDEFKEAAKPSAACICCGANATLFAVKSRDITFEYFECSQCETLFIDPSVIARMDAGESIYPYKAEYWIAEVESARHRSFGTSLARMAETVFYARIPVKRFLDIGTGPGFFLDSVAKQLPAKMHHFFGVEKFPPPPEARSKSENYRVGEVKDLDGPFDAGMCIEVIEHLTPTMLRGMLSALANVSSEQACYLFNTGLPAYVKKEDPEYLDPFVRGHIISYSLKAMSSICREYGFTVIPLKGRAWAFLLEYHSVCQDHPTRRIWSVLPENRELLCDPEMGSVLQVLALDTARAY
jgi:2-polyprenyl-3-methyl-5-hydroxy-6-metoxy-1,4-benzoquinol methylase